MSPTTVIGGVTALQDQLLIQCGPGDLADLRLLMRPGTGLVVTAKDADKNIRGLRDSGIVEPLLADARRYAGDSRVTANVGVSAAWIDAQRTARATAPMTDSGYVGPGDVAGLETVLAGAAGLGNDVIAVLPLAVDWLRTDLSVLIREVNAHGVAIGVVVEHAQDPFAVQSNVRGLVALLRAVNVPVVLLRTDTSGLGAIAFGATAASFGVRSSLRHLRPIGKGFSTTAREAALFRPGLYIVHLDRLALGYAATPTDPMWECSCAVCGGGTVDRLSMKAPSQVLAHTIELLVDLRDHLVVSPRGPKREKSWRAQCKSAVFYFDSAAATAVGWSAPPALKWWQSV